MRLRQHLDRGDTSTLAVIVVASLFLMVGLVVDGGTYLTVQTDARTAAQEAGRAATNQVAQLPSPGQAPTIDTASAVGAGRAYLHTAGFDGTVTATSPQTVRVTATDSTPTIFLSALGINEFTATETAEVSLIRGLTQEVQ